MTTLNTTTRTAIRDLFSGDNDNFTSLRVRGVACDHVVVGVPRNSEVKGWWTEYVYVVVPDGGPVEYLKRLAAKPQTFKTWVGDPDDRLGDWRAMEEAHAFVVKAASDEVLAELS